MCVCVLASFWCSFSLARNKQKLDVTEKVFTFRLSVSQRAIITEMILHDKVNDSSDEMRYFDGLTRQND